MAEQSQASQATLVRLCLCLLLLWSPRRATSMYLDDDDDLDFDFGFGDDDVDFRDDDGFSGEPMRRRLYDGAAAVPKSFNVLNSNASNSSGGSAFCRLLSLQILDLSNNKLTGKLPDCWWKLQFLWFMDLSSNFLSGEIPEADAGFNCSLQSVHLAGNGFTGAFPSVVNGCNSLVTLDIGNNNFSGRIPPWIGSRVPSLRILRLTFNNFEGEIPDLSRLSQLQLLDMSHNSLTGSIPRSFGNLTAMMRPSNGPSSASLDGPTYLVASLDWPTSLDRINITWKDKDFIFQRTIQWMTGIDLSDNSLSQCIPDELTKLKGLRFLNLSKNHLSCSIPRNIGNLTYLESLDLSSNELSGPIPPSMGNLPDINTLDLANNHLSGKIPTGNQLQTLSNPMIYSNNSGLCGFPLDPCESTSLAKDERNDSAIYDQWFYYCVIAGVVFGFWLWFGLLFSIGTWRFAVFFFVDRMQCKVMQKM